MSELVKEKTQWLKSPITEKKDWLQIRQELSLSPYYGNKKKIHLRYTSYKIGSVKESDIFLDDPFVSSRHADLIYSESDGGYFIADCDSKNGIYLNGLKVKKAFLPKQGLLRIGRSVFSWKDESLNALEDMDDFIVSDEKMRETLLRLKSVAKSNLPILLLGETGTGKDIIAQMVHRWSGRPHRAFIALNGATMGGSLADSELFGHRKGAYTGSESHRLGAILAANGGTLFLDELADIPASAQVKLLRALECGEVKALGSDKAEFSDFRLIAATSQDIRSKVESGEFRLDLYYRVAGYVLQIPALRERPKDILAIGRSMVEARGMLLSADSEAPLLSYSWPGNVRELKAVLERALVMARAGGVSQILPEHLLFNESAFSLVADIEASPQTRTLEAMERIFIRKTLDRTGWSRLATARELGIARSTLFEKMKRYGLKDGALLH